jgi:hypothetical protein
MNQCQCFLFANLEGVHIMAKAFEYNELCIATKKIAKERKLGARAYGVVYKVIKFNVTSLTLKNTHMHTHIALFKNLFL